MDYLDINKVKLKNALNIIEVPIIEDLLYEIVNFLSNEQREDGIFNTREVTLKTQIRVHEKFQDNIVELEQAGYIERIKNSSYKVIKHIW